MSCQWGFVTTRGPLGEACTEDTTHSSPIYHRPTTDILADMQYPDHRVGQRVAVEVIAKVDHATYDSMR